MKIFANTYCIIHLWFVLSYQYVGRVHVQTQSISPLNWFCWPILPQRQSEREKEFVC